MPRKAATVLLRDRYGRLVVVASAGTFNKSPTWLCKCDCGNYTTVRGQRLVSGATRSCGCLRREATAEMRRTHGKSESRTYRIWDHMKRRCTDHKVEKWSRYGGRGITVCERWMSFECFLADMGEAPAGMSIDRVNNDLGYEPGNCRWATQTEQCRNMSSNRMLTIDGRSQCMAAWCDELGVPYSLANNRMTKLGWDAERALRTPRKRAAA